MSFEHDLTSNLKAAADAASLPDGDLQAVVRRGTRRRAVARAGTAFGSAALIAFAIGSVVWLAGGEEEPVALTTTTTPVPTTTASPTSTTQPPVTTTSPTTTLPPSTTTTAPPLPPGIPPRQYRGMPDGLAEGYAIHVFEGIFLAGDGLAPFSWQPVDAPSSFSGGDSVRDDKRGGIVYLDFDVVGEEATGAATLMWYPAGADLPVVVAELGTEFFGDLLDVVERNGRWFAVVGTIPSPEAEAVLYELGGAGTDTMLLRDVRRYYVGDPESPVAYSVASPDGSRVAYIEHAACGPASCDQGFENPNPAYLVIVDGEEEEVLFRQEISRRIYDFLYVDDFDGNRVVVVRAPYEPAIGIMTIFVVDFRCGPDCTERFHATGAATTLIGGGPVERGRFDEKYALDECSAAGMGSTVSSQQGLPAAVAETRAAIVAAAATCSWSDLSSLSLWHENNVRDGGRSTEFRLVVSHAAPPFGTFHGEWKLNDDLFAPVTREVVTVLGLPYGTVDGGYRWPAWAGVPVDELDPVVRDQYRSYVETVLGEDFASYLASLEAREWPGPQLIIDEAGTWKAFLRPLS